MKEKQKNPFKSTDVQLARLENSLSESENWIYELKYDGYRIISYIEQGKAKLFTRNDLDTMMN